MKKIVLILFILTSCLLSKAQIPAIFSDIFPDSSKTRVGIIGDYGINSTALTSQFVYSLYRGGYIDVEEKNNVSKRLKNTNTLGGDLNYSIYGAFKPDSLFRKKNVSLFLSLRSREHIDCKFSKDLFNVTFYGNASYAGQTANFNNFSLDRLRYQQFQFGFFTTNYHTEARWGIALSIINGTEYTAISAPNAGLYTSPDGQYITLNAELNIGQSDTASNTTFAFNGTGGSVDLYFEAPYKTRLGNSKISISVADIGGIKYNKKSLFLNQDSIYQYNGIKVDGIYELENSLYSTSQDTIVNSALPFKNQTVNARLPSVLNIINETEISKNFKLAEGIRFVYNANYYTLAYIKGSFRISEQFSFSGLVGYGGYGKVNIGLSTFFNLGKGFIIYAGSDNIEGFIFPKQLCGQALYISLSKNFK